MRGLCQPGLTILPTTHTHTHSSTVERPHYSRQEHTVLVHWTSGRPSNQCLFHLGSERIKLILRGSTRGLSLVFKKKKEEWKEEGKDRTWGEKVKFSVVPSLTPAPGGDVRSSQSQVHGSVVAKPLEERNSQTCPTSTHLLCSLHPLIMSVSLVPHSATLGWILIVLYYFITAAMTSLPSDPSLIKKILIIIMNYFIHDFLECDDYDWHARNRCIHVCVAFICKSPLLSHRNCRDFIDKQVKLFTEIFLKMVLKKNMSKIQTKQTKYKKTTHECDDCSSVW